MKILQYWFRDDIREKWFVKDGDFDRELKRLFEKDCIEVGNSVFNKLIGNKSEKDILSYILLLDQRVAA